jgi:uncharacterized protein (TIGR04255 family)
MSPHKLTTNSPLAQYEKPPLIEVASGIQFEPVQGWQTRHIGQFWKEVAEEYPTTEDQPPIFDVSEGGPRLEILQMPPLRRTFLISRDQNYVIQLQQSRFLHNWRRVRESDVYPRFGTFFDQFLRTWGLFSDFLTRQNLAIARPNRYELTYVNHIEQSEVTLAASLQKYVKMFNWSNVKAQFLTPPSAVNMAWTFPLPEKLGFGQTNLSQGVRPDGRSVLVFVMSCTGSASPKLPLNDWFNSTHDWLARAFTELTTDVAHREWKRNK